MNLKRKFTSFLLALALVVGLIVPTGVYADGPAKFIIYVHKIKLTNLPQVNDFGIQENGDHIGQRVGKDAQTYYDGSQIAPDKLKAYFDDQAAEELPGVTFAYWEISKEAYEALSKSPTDLANLKTRGAVETYKKAHAGHLLSEVKVSPATTTTGTEVDFGVDLTKEEKYYLFIEDNYGDALPDGSSATGSAAVPFLLAFPMAKPQVTAADANAYGKPFASGELHIYPKNTVSKPVVKKTIDNHTGKDPFAVTLGSAVPFSVTTEIPVGSFYKKLKWDDRMTAGLNFAEDSLHVSYKIGNGQSTELTKGDHYTLTKHDDQGFSVELTEAGRKLVNPNPNDEQLTPHNEMVEIKLAYNGIVNAHAKVTIPDRNTVSFVYGNNPTDENTPIPNKPAEDPDKPNGPNNGIIKARKTFDPNEPQGWSATVELRNANTGEKVGDEVILNAQTKEAVWKNLDTNYEYIVVETGRVTGYVPVYEKAGDPGVTNIKNKLNDNPPPVTPDPDPDAPPTVRTFGKRFVKINHVQDNALATATRLAGAEFVVTKQEGGKTKYLNILMGQDPTPNAYNAALEAYRTAVDAYNTAADKSAKLKDVTDTYTAVKYAYLKYAQSITWGEDKAAATRFVSDAEGRIEVSGIAKGDYALQEVRAPKGYAERQDAIQFTANENSLSEGDIEYYANEAGDVVAGNSAPRKAMAIKNKLISIPQTGGMGTVLFTVVGVTFMLLALVAMKRNKTEKE